MDGWCCDDEDGGHSMAILQSFGGSFCSTISDDVLGPANLKSRDSDLVNSAAFLLPGQIYQANRHRFGLLQQCAALTGCRKQEHDDLGMTSGSSNNIDAQIDEQDLFMEQQFFLHEHCRSSSSSSSLQSLSMDNITDSYVSNTMQTYNQHRSVRFPSSESEDAAITRAMMAVLSSSNSSSSAASPPSVMSNPQQQGQASLPRRAFRSYDSVLAPHLELRKSSSGQKMLRNSILMLRSISSVKSEEQVEGRRSTSNQLHHVISERRRRVKLNDSFDTLSTLLPPASKKDKASVLINTRNYLNTLRTQITELEEKNRSLETHLCTDEARQGDGSAKSVKVQIIKPSEPTSDVQQIDIRMTVSVECDIIELVLHVLECFKGLRAVTVAAVDACTYSPRMHIYARANLKLQIKSCDWNEASLQEAMNKAIDEVIATPEPFCLLN
ncbi:unnamed protein product [Musa acuminata subsp. malaccensis]|uniref:(wild Malaysian banana) hypothetical protein n=1 Tax=Musa acuminata subsp. malaccensis TaxID=214687 RepID=A0A804JPV9_MUSAM|nr:PREDICTED: putative transcription factor bHLH041 isoform X1 [Musa acuminata subsp. malaccensis]CAG1848593.1 unnamed protein product [Musa acuminata subsp. malaccensis]